jgi:hypothetical protein
VAGRPRRPLAELLGQRDDDPLGAADVAEPVAVLVLGQLTDEFGGQGLTPRQRLPWVSLVAHPALAGRGALELSRPDRATDSFRFRNGHLTHFGDGQLTHPDSAADGGPPHAQIVAREPDSDQQTLDREIEGSNPSSPAKPQTTAPVGAQR